MHSRVYILSLEPFSLKLKYIEVLGPLIYDYKVNKIVLLNFEVIRGVAIYIQSMYFVILYMKCHF
jgi:hypothetical protein